MWHAFSVLFRVGASLGLRRRRNPGLVCATLSACNFVVCSRNLANGAKRASSGRVEAAFSRAFCLAPPISCAKRAAGAYKRRNYGQYGQDGHYGRAYAVHRVHRARKRSPIDNWPFPIALQWQWKPSFVFAMWHAFSVQFCRLQQELGKRRQTCVFRQSRSGFQPLLSTHCPPARCLHPATSVFRECRYQWVTAYRHLAGSAADGGAGR
jgi:hypothetical protein